MNGTKSAVFITLFAIQCKGKKHYICPAINTLINLLKSHHKIKVKRRWLFACMKYLIDNKYIVTKYRYHNSTKGEICQLPSMITFTLRGIKFLISKRVAGAKEMLKKMLSWVRGDDKRFPKEAEIAPGLTTEERKENLQRLQALLDFL